MLVQVGGGGQGEGTYLGGARQHLVYLTIWSCVCCSLTQSACVVYEARGFRELPSGCKTFLERELTKTVKH